MLKSLLLLLASVTGRVDGSKMTTATTWRSIKDIRLQPLAGRGAKPLTAGDVLKQSPLTLGNVTILFINFPVKVIDIISTSLMCELVSFERTVYVVRRPG
jgi:hypothetical protein